MPTVEIYFQRSCEACHVEIPRIEREAHALGLNVRKIEIDQCPVNRQETCDSISVVPTLMYQGREIGLSDLKRIAEGR